MSSSGTTWTSSATSRCRPQDIFEKVEYDYDIDNASGNELPPDWNPEEDVVHPYVMLDDYTARDVQVGETVICAAADPHPSGEPLDAVPYPGEGQHWVPDDGWVPSSSEIPSPQAVASGTNGSTACA